MTRLNKSAVRAYALAILASQRPHLAGKITRVSPSFFERADAHLAQWIRKEIEAMPTTGKTIK